MVRRTTFTLSATMLLSGLGLASWVTAQSGTRTPPPSYGESQPGTYRVQPSPSAPPPPRELPFEERLWSYLQDNRYQNWAPLAAQTDDFYAGNSPHGEQVKLFANRLAAAHSGELPHGSLLIKENYDASGKTLMAVTVMYRAKGFAAESGDWYWAKYGPDGTVAAMNGMRIAGNVKMCVECHQSADGKDFVFANDRK